MEHEYADHYTDKYEYENFHSVYISLRNHLHSMNLRHRQMSWMSHSRNTKSERILSMRN